MKALCTLIVACCFATVGQAKPIKFVHERTASGTLNGQPFLNILFILTAWGDTDSVEMGRVSNTIWIYHDTSQIELGEITGVNDSTWMRTYFHGRTVGVSYFDGGDYFSGPTVDELRDWNMLSSIGPITGPSSHYVGLFAISTTAGRVLIERWGHEATFTAIVTPEPSSLLLTTLPLMLLALRRR